jgi:hypothetical protein
MGGDKNSDRYDHERRVKDHFGDSDSLALSLRVLKEGETGHVLPVFRPVAQI